MRDIEITTVVGCMNRCVYCPQDRFIKAYLKRSHIMRMSFSTFKRCIDKLPKDVEIHFSGFSEPFLNKECARMILYAHEKGFKVIVFTTGVGMKASDIDAIKNVPFKTFDVHLPDSKGLTKIKVDDKYINIIKKLFSSDIKNMRYGWPASKSIRGAHPKLRKILMGSDVPFKRYWIVTRAGNVKISMISSPTRIKGDMNGCFRLNDNTLLPNGDVVLCCMDWGMKHVLGNLLESSYESLFKGKEFKRVLDGLEDDSIDILCRYCDCAPAKRGLFWRAVNLMQRHIKGVTGR